MEQFVIKIGNGSLMLTVEVNERIAKVPCSVLIYLLFMAYYQMFVQSNIWESHSV